jgi:hypothetical protein
VVSQLAIFVLLTITLIQFFGDSSGLDEDVVLVAPLPIILIQIIIAILVLIYLFTPNVRSTLAREIFLSDV